MNRNIYQFGAALASGIVFGFGLSLSGMLNPARVQGFLDVFGAWDPSLAFVLGGAVVFFLFPKRDEEKRLLAEYHAEDTSAAPEHAALDGA